MLPDSILPSARSARGLAIIAGSLVLACACAPDQAAKSSPAPDRSAAAQMREDAIAKKSVERVAVTSGEAVTGEVPEEILAAAYAALEKETGASRDDVDVIRAEQARWNSGALGCPEPGRNYTDAPVDGYWVVLRYAGRDYDYRGNARGFFTLCKTPMSPNRNGPTM